MGKGRELRYRVIKEYEHYYLARNEKGWKECFDKIFYKPNADGLIIKKIKEFEAREPLDPSKINKAFVWSLKGK